MSPNFSKGAYSAPKPPAQNLTSLATLVYNTRSRTCFSKIHLGSAKDILSKRASVCTKHAPNITLRVVDPYLYSYTCPVHGQYMTRLVLLMESQLYDFFWTPDILICVGLYDVTAAFEARITSFFSDFHILFTLFLFKMSFCEYFHYWIFINKIKIQSGILTRKPVKTNKKKPILKRWSVSLVLENIFISFVRV